MVDGQNSTGAAGPVGESCRGCVPSRLTGTRERQGAVPDRVGSMSLYGADAS